MAPQRKEYTSQRPFDSLRYTKKLEAAGFNRKQAEAQAETMTEVVFDHLASKSDLIAVESKLEGTITAVGERLDGRITAVEKSLESKVDAVEKSLESKVDAVEERLESKIGAVEEKLESTIGAVEEKLEAKIDKFAEVGKNERALIRKDIVLLGRDMKIWFGSMLVLAVGLVATITSVSAHLH